MKYESCMECGLIVEYCEKCKIHHHRDRFRIEHKDYQEQLNKKRRTK